MWVYDICSSLHSGFISVLHDALMSPEKGLLCGELILAFKRTEFTVLSPGLLLAVQIKVLRHGLRFADVRPPPPGVNILITLKKDLPSPCSLLSQPSFNNWLPLRHRSPQSLNWSSLGYGSHLPKHTRSLQPAPNAP